MKIDTGIGANLSSVSARAREAEQAGLDCLWAAETTNDPFLSLVLAAEHSQRVSIGTSIAIAFARNPMSLAYTTNQLQDFSRGRLVLGLGSQVRAHIQRRFSAEWSRPAARMREFILALRAVWGSWNEGATLDFQGEFYTHTLMTPLFSPRPHAFGAPRVFLAAVGERMTEVAGEVADGIITHGLSSARYVREVTLPALERGLLQSGRTRRDIEVTCPGFIAVVENEEQEDKARTAMRRQLAFYGSTPAYRPVLDLHGWGDLQPELYDCSKRGAWEEMSVLVNDEMLNTFSIVTYPESLAGEVRVRYGGLADRINAAWWRKSWWPAVGEELRSL
jgi:probable F420-dependent oxidoreductase